MNTVKLNFNDNGSIDIYELDEEELGVENWDLVKTVHSLRELNRELKKYDPLR